MLKGIMTAKQGIESITNLSEITEKECIPNIPKRYILTMMCFLSQMVVTLQRSNMTVAIVAMVNHTAVYNINVTSTECPAIEKEGNAKQWQGEFSWSPPLQGIILGAFGYGQVVGQLFGGRLAEIFGGKRVMGLSLLLASLLTFLTPVTAGWEVYVLVFLRVIIGILLGSASTISSFLIGHWIPRKERSVHSSIVMSGTAFGSALGVVLSGMICDSDVLGGWPLTFYSFGVAGCLWVLFWFILIHETPAEHPSIPDEELKYILRNIDHDGSRKKLAIPWRKMLSSVPFWALVLAHFGQFWAVGFFNTVHVLYMGNIINIPLSMNGQLSSLPHLLKGMLAWVCSYPADWLLKKKLTSSTTVRKIYVTISSLVFSFCFVGITLAGCDHLLNATLFVLSFATNALMIPGTVVTCINLAPDFRGTVTGIVFAVGTTSSFIIPALVGTFTKHEQSMAQWNKVFYISIAISIGTAIVFDLFGSAEPQDWGRSSTNDEDIDEKKKVSVGVNDSKCSQVNKMDNCTTVFTITKL